MFKHVENLTEAVRKGETDVPFPDDIDPDFLELQHFMASRRDEQETARINGDSPPATEDQQEAVGVPAGAPDDDEEESDV